MSRPRWQFALGQTCGVILLLIGAVPPSIAQTPGATQVATRLVESERLVPSSMYRNWGPEQATGQPDTPEAGDRSTAWASRSTDGQQEWLECTYEQPVHIRRIMVHETYNPGALYKVTAFKEDGSEEIAWEGEDPTPRDQPKGISVIPVELEFASRQVKIHLDSPAVPGWNEIDAVGIEDDQGRTWWAVTVAASSTYASPLAVEVPAVTATKRNWGPEQVIGQPDTPAAGDRVTAWASATQDGMQEWLTVEFEQPQSPAEIVVHETYNPGAIYKITAFKEDGSEELAWEGQDPTPRDQPKGISIFPVQLDFAFKKIKIYIDSPAVPGWNEIDAVGLRAADESTMWATHVEASSTYAQPGLIEPEPIVTTPELVNVQVLQELMQLKADVAEMKQQLAELAALRKEISELKTLLQSSQSPPPFKAD